MELPNFQCVYAAQLLDCIFTPALKEWVNVLVSLLQDQPVVNACWGVTAYEGVLHMRGTAYEGELHMRGNCIWGGTAYEGSLHMRGGGGEGIWWGTAYERVLLIYSTTLTCISSATEFISLCNPCFSVLTFVLQNTFKVDPYTSQHFACI